jgi:hypothetical protein
MSPVNKPELDAQEYIDTLVRVHGKQNLLEYLVQGIDKGLLKSAEGVGSNNAQLTGYGMGIARDKLDMLKQMLNLYDEVIKDA